MNSIRIYVWRRTIQYNQMYMVFSIPRRVEFHLENTITGSVIAIGLDLALQRRYSHLTQL